MQYSGGSSDAVVSTIPVNNGQPFAAAVMVHMSSARKHKCVSLLREHLHAMTLQTAVFSALLPTQTL